MRFDISQFCSGLKQVKQNLWTLNCSERETFPGDVHKFNFSTEDQSFWFLHRAQCISAIVEKFFSRDLFFDIGGGTGFVAEMIAKKNKMPVVVIEPHPDVKDIVPLRPGVSLIHANFERLEIFPESLPAVGLFDVIEHIEDDEKFLENVANKVKPGGKILITVPALEFLWSMEDQNAGHFRRYDLGKLTSLLEQKKMRVIYSSHLFSFLVPPIFFLRTVPTWLGLRKPGNWQAYRQDHKLNPIFSSFISWLSSWELGLIKKESSPVFGSSIIVCAEKLS
ncbi:MAG: hypothetical protein A4S09_12205 [Proteobacteria bacterium SG_bin7]|nr:MAG: hypothetical protein A4S09_12205 [Proteobacteria bacterium SG_bin7]